MEINNVLKIILLLPFVGLSILLLLQRDLRTSLESFYPAFITVSLTIATFSISFSFLQYQFSAYKALLRSISLRQMSFYYATIVIALTPLFILIFKKELVVVASFIALPILMYSTILLWVVAREESNPQILLRRKIDNKKSLTRFLERTHSQTIEYASKQSRFEFSKGDETPLHDIGHPEYYVMTVPENPFHLVNDVIELALENLDLDVFETALTEFLRLTDTAVEATQAQPLDFRFTVEHLIESSFERVMIGTLGLTKNSVVHNLFIVRVSEYLKSKALGQEQVRSPFLEMSRFLAQFAKEILSNNNRDGVILITSLFRQLAQKGIYDNSEKFLFKQHLAIFPTHIKEIGNKAVQANDSDILYRCLEDLGFLGCSAIKHNHYDVGIECLQALVQLGREARVSNLKCFWTHCSLEPVDHAEQRIWWLLSWVHRLPEKEQERWIQSFETAYSRLRGFSTTIKIDKTGENAVVKFIDTKKPHIESFSEERFYREINYSDFSELKESKLR